MRIHGPGIEQKCAIPDVGSCRGKGVSSLPPVESDLAVGEAFVGVAGVVDLSVGGGAEHPAVAVGVAALRPGIGWCIWVKAGSQSWPSAMQPPCSMVALIR